MLLERRQAPRYVVDQPASVILDNVVETMIINASETGVTLATPYKPILNSVIPITIHLPDNQSPCHARAQVVWSAASGQIGLKLLKPESFRAHFETWRTFTTQQVSVACGVSGSQSDQQPEDEMFGELEEPNVDAAGRIDALRALLADTEASEVSFFRNHLGTMAALIAFALFGAGIWVWHARGDHGPDNASTAASAEAAPGAASTATDPALPAQEIVPSALPPDRATIPSAQEVPRVSTRPSVAAARPQRRARPHAQIVMALNRFVPVHPKLLRNPDRIYFDVRPGTHGEISQASLLKANDRLVSRIRIGHAQSGYTRVVLDLRQRCQYQAKVSSTAPYKLIINLRPVTAEKRL